MEEKCDNGKVKKNTVYSMIKSISTIVFPIITFPYVSRVLQTENIGKINFGNSIVSYFSLIASLGITTYAIRECSKVKNDRAKLERVASEILSINVFTMCLSYFILFVLIFAAKPLSSYREIIILQSSCIVFSTMGAEWLNTSMEDLRYITIRTFLFQLISLVLMFCLVRVPEDYMIYVGITVVSSSGANIVNIIYRRKFCKITFTTKMQLKKHIPPILKLFAMLLSQQIFCNSDTTMIGIFRGDFEVGLYSTAVKVYNIANSLIASITWVVMPRLAYAFSKRDYSNINGILKYALSFILTLGIPCVVGINLYAQEIIALVGGDMYYGAIMTLRILSLTLLFSLIWGFVMNIILLPSGKDGVCLLACGVSAIVNVIANALFIPKYGIEAAAICTTISQVIGLMLCVGHIDKQIELPGIKKIIFSTCVGGTIVGIVLCLVRMFIENIFGRFVVGVGISGIIYFIILLILKNEIACEMFENIRKKFI